MIRYPATRLGGVGSMEMKIAGGGFVTSEAKTQTINGIETGLVEGYIASKALEDGRWPDKFEGINVFGDSIADHRKRNNRPVRMLYMHDRRQQIGMFPIETVREDERGLFGVGHINLGTQKGQEVYALARQGAISDFSIGFSIEKTEHVRFEEIDGIEIRYIMKATIHEGSLVDEPMNKDAMVTSVKAAEKITIERLSTMTARELEEALEKSGLFSRTARRAMVSELKGLTRREECDVLGDVLAVLKQMREPSVGA